MDYDESSSSPEEPLPGTFTTLAKVGNTVRRSIGPWTPAVHALLRHLERVGFNGAPRVLDIDAQGREVLTYMPGNVPRGARAPTSLPTGRCSRSASCSGATTKPSRGSRFPRESSGTGGRSRPAERGLPQ